MRVFTRVGAGLGAAFLLAGCSADRAAQWGRFGMPESASDRAPVMGSLWNGSWIAALAVGVVVWALIGYAAIRFRRKQRGGSDAPRQTRYNLPMEILYTALPLLIVGVLFVFTVQAQNKVLAKADDGQPAHTIDVVGQKWSWTFNYRDSLSREDPGTDVWEAGTIRQSPDLYLPVDESVRFNLSSPDVIHSFWVPAFYFKRDVIPGHPNSFDLTPTKTGTFIGKCAELCGTYHSAMIFKVHVVSKGEYEAKLAELAAKGQTGTNYGSGGVQDPKLPEKKGEGE